MILERRAAATKSGGGGGYEGYGVGWETKTTARRFTVCQLLMNMGGCYLGECNVIEVEENLHGWEDIWR